MFIAICDVCGSKKEIDRLDFLTKIHGLDLCTNCQEEYHNRSKEVVCQMKSEKQGQ